MNFIKGRMISLLLVIPLSLILLIGCSNSASTAEGDGDEEVTLEFWTINLKADYGDYIEGLINEYEENNPNITIDWVDVPGDDIEQKLISVMAGDESPDVVNLSNYQVLSVYENLYTITELVDEEELAAYFPNMLESLTFDGETKAFPWYHGGPPIGLLNTEIYEEAGLDPEDPPETWDELLENGQIIHDSIPGVYGSNDFPSLEILMTADIELLSEDGKQAAFNTPEAVSFIEKFIDAYNSGSIAPGVAAATEGANATNVTTYQQTFSNGLIGHNGRNGSTHLKVYEDTAPDVFDNLKVFPAITDNGKYARHNIFSFAVPQQSENPEEAGDFALFFTNAENQLEFSKLAPVFPSTAESLEDPYFTDIEGDTIYDEARRIQVETMDQLTINNVNQHLREQYRREISAVMLGEKSVEEALSDVEEYWNEELSD